MTDIKIEYNYECYSCLQEFNKPIVSLTDFSLSKNIKVCPFCYSYNYHEINKNLKEKQIRAKEHKKSYDFQQTFEIERHEILSEFNSKVFKKHTIHPNQMIMLMLMLLTTVLFTILVIGSLL